jgi:hypothetical protein
VAGLAGNNCRIAGTLSVSYGDPMTSHLNESRMHAMQNCFLPALLMVANMERDFELYIS